MREVTRLNLTTGETLQTYHDCAKAAQWLKENGYNGNRTSIWDVYIGRSNSSGGFG